MEAATGYNIILTLLLVCWGSIPLAGIITGIIILVKSIISLAKNGNSVKLKYNLIAFLCILIAIASWFLNFGWIRFLMTIFCLPIIHTTAFMIVTHISLSYIEKTVMMKKYMIISFITYLLGYIFLPDGGDYGPLHVFFGLIHNDIVADFSAIISSFSFIVNIAILVIQVTEIKAIKRTLS